MKYDTTCSANICMQVYHVLKQLETEAYVRIHFILFVN